MKHCGEPRRVHLQHSMLQLTRGMCIHLLYRPCADRMFSSQNAYHSREDALTVRQSVKSVLLWLTHRITHCATQLLAATQATNWVCVNLCPVLCVRGSDQTLAWKNSGLHSMVYHQRLVLTNRRCLSKRRNSCPAESIQ